jgi:site-specific recombinase XerD
MHYSLAMPTTIWRRHTSSCRFSSKGRDYLKCSCPLWADGYVDGKRTLRQSLKTRDLARARKKAADLASDDNRPVKALPDAIGNFLAHCEGEGLKFSTFRKYRNTLTKLQEFCADREIDNVSELTIERLDAFRASRKLKPITSSKELQLLRQFCGFCRDRRWMEDNPARRIKGPRNIRPNDVEPFTGGEVIKIIQACDLIGRTPYERLRARAMVLALRYTAVRLGDVAMLARDRVTRHGKRWRIFLRTEKNGKPIFLPIPYEMKAALDIVPLPQGTKGASKYFFWNGVSSERTMKSIVERSLRAVFAKSRVTKAHAHRFRHTLATELIGAGASFESVADILGNSPDVVRKHYAKWSPARQDKIDGLMENLHSNVTYTPRVRVQ